MILRSRLFAVRLFGLAAAVGFSAAGTPAAAAWRATGPFGGDAELVRTVPLTKNRVVAGARNGLIFVSDNGGASWRNIAFPAQFAGVLHALEVDPRSPGTWFAGIEGENSWMSGVYRTCDGGNSWTLLSGTKGISVWSLTLSPGDPDVMAAGTGTGVFLSRDAGENWTRISPEGDTELRPVVSLAFHPTNSKILYAGTTHLPWRTTDGGATWESVHEGMMDDSDVFSIQVDPVNPARVFASACSGVYGSSDRGSLWHRLETPKGAFRTHFVAIDPKHPETVFAGTTEGLLKSADSGLSWRRVSAESVKSIAFDPWVPGRVYFASPTGGLLISTDGGNTLREANAGFTNRSFTTLAGSGNQLYSSSVYESSAGIYRTDSMGLRWVHGPGPASDQLLALAVAPDDSLLLFAAGYHSLHESKDGGKTWLPRKGPPGAVRLTALLMLKGNILLAGTEEGLFRSRDGATTWMKCSNARIESLHGSGSWIAVVATQSAFASTDAGVTWKRCGEPTPSASWYGLDFDAAHNGTALAATPSGLFRSDDGCASWVPIRAGLRPETASIVLFHPTRPGEAFVSQGGKVYCSTDGGRNWLPVGDDGPSNSGPSSLFVLPAAPDRLFALFPRRGVFSTSPKENLFQ